MTCLTEGRFWNRICGRSAIGRPAKGRTHWTSRRRAVRSARSIELSWKAGTMAGGCPGSSTRRACHWTSCRSSRRLVPRRGLGMMSWQSSISRRRPLRVLQPDHPRGIPARQATGHLLQSLSASRPSFLFDARRISFAVQCRPTSSMGALQPGASRPGCLVR